MDATTAASSASRSPGMSPVIGGGVSLTQEFDTQQLHSASATGEAVGNAGDKGDVIMQNNAVSHTASPSATATSMALSQSPTTQLPSAQSSSTQPPPAQPSAPQMLAVSTGPLQVPELHQNHLGLPSTTASSSVSSCLAPPQFQRQIPTINQPPTRVPSPEPNHGPNFQRDVALLSEAVQQACPEAVREVVRMHWAKCVMGSEFHNAFIMHSIIHHAGGATLRRAIQDYGHNMAREALSGIFFHIGQQDIDSIAPQILGKCSDQFLDKALEQRLKTIDARSLINSLARAERLGYETSDILEDARERVVPGPVIVLDSPAPGPVAFPVAARGQYQPQPAQNALFSTDPRCTMCGRVFKHTRNYEYHMQKKLCTKAPNGNSGRRFTCEECGAIFSTKIGQQYHITNTVCGPRLTPITISSHSPSPVPRPGPQYVRQSIPSSQTTPNSSRPSTSSGPITGQMEKLALLHHDIYSRLDPAHRALFITELLKVETSHEEQCKEAEEIDDPIKRQILLDTLQNAFTSKQNLVKRKYELKAEEKQRLGAKHGLGSPGASETPMTKRQKTDVGSHPPVRPAAGVAPESQNRTPPRPTAIPTGIMVTPKPNSTAVPQTPQTGSSSSLRRKAFRVSTHSAPRPRPTVNNQDALTGSASKPVVLDDSSDETDTDGEIPAIMPSKKAT